MDWNLGRASQRSKDLNFDGLKFGRASQRSDRVESWTCFPEVQRLNFGHASQRSDGLKFVHASSILHQLNTKPNTIKSHKIYGNKLMQLQYFLS